MRMRQLQAAAALAELASRNAADPLYESPYARGAAEQGGMDLPIWQKLSQASFKASRWLLCRGGPPGAGRGGGGGWLRGRAPGGSGVWKRWKLETEAQAHVFVCPLPLPLLLQDGKFELGRLRGGKMDDITVVCAVVVAAAEGAAAEQQ